MTRDEQLVEWERLARVEREAKKPKLEPWQVIANQLQVSRINGTREHLCEKFDNDQLRIWAKGCVRMLKAYGYVVKHPSLDE